MMKKVNFVSKVARINESIYSVRALLDSVITDVEKGRLVLEESNVDVGRKRTVIRLSVRWPD